jgi:molybdate transport system substrate-binding protein
VRPRTLSRIAVSIVAAAALTAVAAPAGAQHQVAAKPSGSITVFGAASLTEAFTQIGTDFQKKNKGTTVAFNFNSSSILETQIEQGAPADTFASADTANMDKAVAANDIAPKPVIFAKNRLEIAVAPGNPKKIKSLADTVKSGVQLVLCAPEVPCGKYALQAYQEAGVTVPTVPTGTSVKDTLSKVTLGEADAAVVYVTDVKSAKGQVTGVPIPDKHNVIAEYPIATVKATQNATTANAFKSYVLSKAGQATLRKYGFLKP